MRRTSRWLGALCAAGLMLGALPARADTPPPTPAPAVLPATTVVDSTATVPTTAGLQAAIAPLLTRARLGANSAVVVDAATGDVLFGEREARPRIPASTSKLLTAAAALTVLGPAARITTRAVVDDPEASVPVITLVGGGDATLTRRDARARASLADLAEQVATAMPVDAVDLAFDASAFSGPALAPSWPASFPGAGIVAPVSALMVDQGRVRPGASARVANPARQAARAFAQELRERGLRVRTVRRGVAAADAEPVGEVHSAPVSALVQRMLTDSDNDLAEALARLVAIASGQPATFAGGAEAIELVADRLGLPTDGLALVDGSGLSGRNRIAPLTLGALLAQSARGEDATVSGIDAGLAVAGLTGTLADRFTTAAARPARGVVRAKTGTLTGVSSLAGVVRDADGRVLVFAVLANRVRSSAQARAALDTIAARLAECGCR